MLGGADGRKFSWGWCSWTPWGLLPNLNTNRARGSVWEGKGAQCCQHPILELQGLCGQSILCQWTLVFKWILSVPYSQICQQCSPNKGVKMWLLLFLQHPGEEWMRELMTGLSPLMSLTGLIPSWHEHSCSSQGMQPCTGRASLPCSHLPKCHQEFSSCPSLLHIAGSCHFPDTSSLSPQHKWNIQGLRKKQKNKSKPPQFWITQEKPHTSTFWNWRNGFITQIIGNSS